MEKLQQNVRLESHFSVGFWLIRLMSKTKWILECPCDYAFSICARVLVKGSRRGCVNVKVVILIGENKVLNRDRKESEKNQKRLCAQTKRAKAHSPLYSSWLFLVAQTVCSCREGEASPRWRPRTPPWICARSAARSRRPWRGGGAQTDETVLWSVSWFCHVR